MPTVPPRRHVTGMRLRDCTAYVCAGSKISIVISQRSGLSGFAIFLRKPCAMHHEEPPPNHVPDSKIRWTSKRWARPYKAAPKVVDKVTWPCKETGGSTQFVAGIDGTNGKRRPGTRKRSTPGKGPLIQEVEATMPSNGVGSRGSTGFDCEEAREEDRKSVV